jgi:hypothetical protein
MSGWIIKKKESGSIRSYTIGAYDSTGWRASQSHRISTGSTLAKLGITAEKIEAARADRARVLRAIGH